MNTPKYFTEKNLAYIDTYITILFEKLSYICPKVPVKNYFNINNFRVKIWKMGKEESYRLPVL